MIIKEMHLCKENPFILKNLYQLDGFGANQLTKEFATKGRKKISLNDFLTFERTAAVSECGLVYTLLLLMR